MFFRKKEKIKRYDPSIKVPVIRASICTGEKVAGFRYLEGGRFEEVMLKKDQKDLQDFIRTYNIKEKIETIY